MIEKAKEKQASEKCIKITKNTQRCNDKKKKKMDKKVDAYEKQLRSEYMKLMN